MTKLFFDLIEMMSNKNITNPMYFRVIPYVIYEIKTRNKCQLTVDDFKKLITPEFNIIELLLNDCECHNDLLPCEVADIFLNHYYSTITRILNF